MRNDICLSFFSLDHIDFHVSYIGFRPGPYRQLFDWISLVRVKSKTQASFEEIVI
jgi:hypothetical protein